MSPLRSHLVDFVRGERGGIDRGTACVELAMLGRCSPEMWAVATAKQWSKEIDAAIAVGDLLTQGSKISLPPPAEPEATTQQLTLFGM